MAVDYGIKTPTNRIVERGDPTVQELRVETATSMYPGRLVKKGTTDVDIVVNTSKVMPVGVLGYEHAQGQFKPTDVDTLYTQYDHAPVLNGPCNLVLSLDATNIVTKGDPLYPAADGEVTTWIAGADTATMVAIAEQSVAYSATSADFVARWTL